MIRTINAIRKVTPLREGGSLPAIVEAGDGQMYVMKFIGAGQGRKVPIAELVAGEIGRALGLRVLELAFANLDPELGPSEPDPEIFDLLRASVGLNSPLWGVRQSQNGTRSTVRRNGRLIFPPTIRNSCGGNNGKDS